MSASVQTALLSAPLAPFMPVAIFFRSMPRLVTAASAKQFFANDEQVDLKTLELLQVA